MPIVAPIIQKKQAEIDELKYSRYLTNALQSLMALFGIKRNWLEYHSPT